MLLHATKKRPRILIKAISQHIGKAMLNSAALLMRQSQLITNSPRAFIFLQLHLQKHCAVETFCQVPAGPRSTHANRGSAWGATQGGLLPAQEPPGLAQPCLPWTPGMASPRRAAGAGGEPGFSSAC